MSELILVTGGVRSGKSTYAQKLAQAQGGRLFFIATAEPLDADMRKRINAHRKGRSGAWTTVEEPLRVAASVRSLPKCDKTIVLDCFTLLICNLIHKGASDRQVCAEIMNIIRALRAKAQLSVIVTNEVGCGIVPENGLSRRFRDLQGTVNRIAAGEADRVCLLVSGIPVHIK